MKYHYISLRTLSFSFFSKSEVNRVESRTEVILLYSICIWSYGDHSQTLYSTCIKALNEKGKQIYSFLLYYFLSNTTELGESEKGKFAINFCLKCDSVKGQHYISQVCCRKWKCSYITYLEELKFVKSNLLKLVRTHRLKQHAQVCTRSSVYILMYGFQFSVCVCVYETLECVDERTSDSCAFSPCLFSFCLFVLSNFNMIVFDLLCLKFC